MRCLSLRIVMATAFVLFITTVFVTDRWSSTSKDNAIMKAANTVIPCKSGHCEEHAINDAYNPGHEMKRRGQRLKANCEKLHKGIVWNDITAVKSLVGRNLLVDDEHQIIVCIIPKIASSNLRRMFLQLGNYVNTTNAFSITNSEVLRSCNKITFLNDDSKEDVRRRLRRYKKVIVVRDHFERLISAFRSKFLSPRKDSVFKTEAPKIIKALRKNKNIGGEYNITFADFIQYLIIQQAHKEKFDQHWEAYTDSCKPCLIQYNYVGKYETVDEEMNFVLKEIGAENSTAFPKREYLYKDVTASALLEQYYRTIPPDQIQKLIEIYSHDQQLFDLPVPDTLTKLLNPL